MSDTAALVDERVAILQARARADGGDMTRADALSRIHGASLNDVPRLRAEADHFRDRRSRLDASWATAGDPGKFDSADALVTEADAAADREAAVGAAAAAELGVPATGSASAGGVGEAFQPSVSIKES